MIATVLSAKTQIIHTVFVSIKDENEKEFVFISDNSSKRGWTEHTVARRHSEDFFKLPQEKQDALTDLAYVELTKKVKELDNLVTIKEK